MKKKDNYIEHEGVVESIENNLLKVRFVTYSACASCQAKGVCSASEMEEKELFITDFSGKHSIGEQVTILLQTTMGFRALFFAYIFPLILVLAIIIILTTLKFNEGIVGLSAIAILPIYYFCMYIFRNKIEKKFSFSLKN